MNVICISDTQEKKPLPLHFVLDFRFDEKCVRSCQFIVKENLYHYIYIHINMVKIRAQHVNCEKRIRDKIENYARGPIQSN